MLNDIEWRVVPGYPRYLVSSNGEVLSLARKEKKLLKVYLDRYGYRTYTLYSKPKHPRYFKAHRLVALCFVPNPDSKATVNHKDGNKLNNHFTNLEWATVQEQIEHAVINGLRGCIKGIPKSEEHRANLSKARMGVAPWNKGKKGLQVAWNKGLKINSHV